MPKIITVDAVKKAGKVIDIKGLLNFHQSIALRLYQKSSVLDAI